MLPIAFLAAPRKPSPRHHMEANQSAKSGKLLRDPGKITASGCRNYRTGCLNDGVRDWGGCFKRNWLYKNGKETLANTARKREYQPESGTRPCLMAKATSSAVFLSFNCCMRRYLWDSTVRGEIFRRPAISLTD